MITLQEIAGIVKSNSKFWIAFTGDSITSCEWVHPNWREIVEYVLKEEMTKFLNDWKTSEWGIRGFNFGYDGATTKDILERVDLIKKVNPDLVIGVMGGNDPAFKITVEEHVGNIKDIIERLGTKVVWCTSIPAGEGSAKNDQYRPYAKACMQINVAGNLQLIDIFSQYKDFPLEKIFTFISEDNPIEQIKAGDPDLLHPNQLGNAYLAKIVLKDVFGIEFNSEKYWSNTMAGEKYPGY